MIELKFEFFMFLITKDLIRIYLKIDEFLN